VGQSAWQAQSLCFDTLSGTGRLNTRLKIGETDHGNRDGEDLWALRDVSFTVEQGEVLGFIRFPPLPVFRSLESAQVNWDVQNSSLALEYDGV